MPSGREIKRLQSDNKHLREQVDAFEADKAEAVRAALAEQQARHEEERAEWRRACDEEVRRRQDAEGHVTSIQDRCDERIAKMRVEVTTVEARVRGELASEWGRLEAERSNFATTLGEAMADVRDAERRLAELVENIEERGRRKENLKAQQIMNRAVMGCQKARAEIRAAALRHQLRQQRKLAAPGPGQVLKVKE